MNRRLWCFCFCFSFCACVQQTIGGYMDTYAKITMHDDDKALYNFTNLYFRIITNLGLFLAPLSAAILTHWQLDVELGISSVFFMRFGIPDDSVSL